MPGFALPLLAVALASMFMLFPPSLFLCLSLVVTH